MSNELTIEVKMQIINGRIKFWEEMLVVAKEICEDMQSSTDFSKKLIALWYQEDIQDKIDFLESILTKLQKSLDQESLDISVNNA